MVEAVTEFFARLAEGYMSPAGLIFTTLVALTLLVVGFNALVAALRVEPETRDAAPKAATPRHKPLPSALPRAA